MNRGLIAVFLTTIMASDALSQDIRGLICDIYPSAEIENPNDWAPIDRGVAVTMTDHPLNLKASADYPLYSQNVFAALEFDSEEMNQRDPFGLHWYQELSSMLTYFDSTIDDFGYDKTSGVIGELRKKIQDTLSTKPGGEREGQSKKWGSFRPGYNDSCRECGLLGGRYAYNKIDFSDFNIELPCEGVALGKEDMAAYHMSRAVWEYSMIRRDVFTITSEEAAASYVNRRNKLVNGLPMWPWETSVNGYGRFKAKQGETQPSLQQLLFFRPSIAPALRFSGSDESQLDAALLFELGIINYKKNSEFKEWSGLSLIATVTNDNGTGYGAAYRKNNWIIGAARHPSNDEWLLYASIDLYDLITNDAHRTTNANRFLEQMVREVKRCKDRETKFGCELPDEAENSGG